MPQNVYIITRLTPFMNVAVGQHADHSERSAAALHSDPSSGANSDAGLGGHASDAAGLRPGGRRGGFRVCGSHFFLTYPRCDASPESLADFLGGLGACGITIGREQHADGGQHLHAACSFPHRKDVRSANFFDLAAGGSVYHPNLQRCRDLHAVRKYVCKDGDVLERGSHVGASDGSKKCSRTDEIAKRALSGDSLLTLCDEAPGMFMLHGPKIQRLISWYAVTKSATEMQAHFDSFVTRLGSMSPDLLNGLNSEEKVVIKWLGDNIGRPKAFKSPQCYLYGPPNSGKTSLINVLQKWVPTYMFPTEDFYDQFDQNLHRLICLDEFRAQKTIQCLNQWLDGQVMPIRIKGSQSLKTKNLPFLILSNFSLSEAYSKTDDAHLEALRARLTVVKVQSLFGLVDLLNKLMF